MESNQCKYCNRTVRTLTVLSCTHQICSKCILKLCLFNNNTLPFNYTEEVTLKCLECNSGELRTTRQMIHQICTETPESEKKPLCTDHNKEEDLYCKECKAYMCQVCFDTHRLARALANHQSTNQPVPSFHNYCSKHNLQLLYQCLKCDTPLCEVCTKIDHKDHSLEFIRDFYHKKRKEVENNIKLPFKTFEEYDEYLAKEKDQIIRAINEVSVLQVDQIQTLINSLTQMKEGVVDNLRQQEEKATVNYEITRGIYKNLYQELQTLSADDYLNVDRISKLPKVHHLPKNVESVNTTLSQGLKEINELIDKLKLVKDNFIENLNEADNNAPNEKLARGRIQLRGGMGGGNPRSLTLFGEKNNHLRSISKAPLDMEKEISTHEQCVGYFESPNVPNDKIWVLKEITFSAESFDDSNGSGYFKLYVGETIQEIRNCRINGKIKVNIPMNGVKVYAEIGNSTFCDVVFEGELVSQLVKELEFWVGDLF